MTKPIRKRKRRANAKPVIPLNERFKIASETEAYLFYLDYCALHGLTPLPPTSWRLVTRTANRHLAAMLVEEGKTVYLPQKLGNLLVYRKKMNFKKKFVNWAETKKQGRRVLHINDHSDNFQSFVHWQKITCNFPNQGFYAFSPVRDVSRAMAKIMQLPNGYRRYAIKPEPAASFSITS